MTDQFRPIFVVGVGRSGTSLLQSMLASHPLVTFPPETAFLRRKIMSGQLQRILDSDGVEGVERELLCDGNLQRLGIDLSAFAEFHKERISLDGASYIYRALLESYQLRAGASIVGDKDPRLVEYMDVVTGLFPQSMFLHIVRDPRDILSSKKYAGWSRGRPSVFHVAAANIQWKLAKIAEVDLDPKHYFKLKYEDLLALPHESMSEICEWIGIEFSVEMLDFQHAAKQLVSTEEMDWKKETLGPLLKDNSGMWRSRLSPFEAGLVETGNRAQMTAMRYERHAPNTAIELVCMYAGKIVGYVIGMLAAIFVLHRFVSREN